MIAVLDASVIVKWFFPDPVTEPDTDRALDILDGVRTGILELRQPPHWLAEVAAVVARLEPRIASEAIALLDAMQFSVVGDVSIYKRASMLAANLNLHLFDTLYHAVALEQNGTLVTADGRYFKQARKVGRILFLPDWRRPSQR